MATHADPFRPRIPLTREQLERYASGQLDAGERQTVEQHLEADPLLRDAVEGLQMPGAGDALRDLRPPKASSGRWKGRLLGAGILLGLIVLLVAVWRTPAPQQQEIQEVLGGGMLPRTPQDLATDSTLNVLHAEIAASKPLPEPLQVDRSKPDHFRRSDTLSGPVQRETVERLTGTRPALERQPDTIASHRDRIPRLSRRLIFLHGLKVVHPQELYGDRGSALASPGIPADVSDTTGTFLATEDRRTAYLAYMDAALGAFTEGRQRSALDDLYILLGQYPDDVNARFYAGLCCYDLGLLPRARILFAAVAHDPVDPFDEEAEWYLALTTERMDGPAAAAPLFQRIAQAGGFYAVQARTKLQ